MFLFKIKVLVSVTIIPIDRTSLHAIGFAAFGTLSRDGQQYRPAFGGVLQTARILVEARFDAAASVLHKM